MRMLFFDQVLELEPGVRMVGVKNVTLSEEFLGAHFDRRPVMPGALVVETMAQVAGWLVNHTLGFRRSALMSLVEGVALRRPIQPGDRLVVEARLLSGGLDSSLAATRAWVDGDEVASVERIIFYNHPAADECEIEENRQRWLYYGGKEANGSR